MTEYVVNIVPALSLFLATQSPIAIDSVRVEALAAYLPSRAAISMSEILPGRWVELMADADSIECFLVCPGWEHSGTKCTPISRRPSFYPFAIRKFGGYLDETQRAALMSVVLNPASYWVSPNLGDMKMCAVNYDIAYVLTVTSERSDGVERFMLSVCHSCLYLQVRRRGDEVLLDIDFAGDEMLELSKALFPEDADLDALYRRFHGKYRQSGK